MKKKGDSLKGFRGIKTMHSLKEKSTPKTQSSSYLELYVLEKEKERLLKEDENLCMRQNIIRRRLEEINLRMEDSRKTDALKGGEKETLLNENTSTQKKKAKNKAKNKTEETEKEWKKMSLNY